LKKGDYSFLKTRWVLLLVLIVFILCKIPHLYYPYYWDESWPYAAAIRQMYYHGISLMPGAIDGELSRGHPLFFHAAGALWMNIFGQSHFSMHCFALFIAVSCLIAVYEAGLKLFNQRTAALSVLLVATQALFFLQSSFLLFEILVALLGFLSLYFYVRDKYFLTALCLTALFYTKESGLIMGFVLGANAFIGLFNKHISARKRLYRITSILIPCMLIMVFFIIQKVVSGWYILPLYSAMVEHSWKSFWYKLRMGCIRDTFYMGMRYWYFIVLLFLSLLAAIKNRQFRYLTIFLPTTIIYYYVDDMRAGRILPSIPFFIVFIFSIVLFIYSLRKLHFFSDTIQERFTTLLITFIFFYLCFSAMNFYTYRYMLAAIIPLMFLTSVLYDKIIERTYPFLFYPVLLSVFGIGFFALRNDIAYGDTRQALDGMEVQQNIVDFMEANNYYNKNISAGSFLELEHLKDAGTGFLRSNKNFKKVRWEIDNNTNYVIFDNIEPDYRYDSFIKDTAFRRICRFEKGALWGEIYRRK
jgi:hypothetical protein